MITEEYGQRAIIELFRHTPYARDMLREPFAHNERDPISIAYDAYERLDELFASIEEREGDIDAMEAILQTGAYNGVPLIYSVGGWDNLVSYGRRLEGWKYLYRCMELAGTGPEILEQITTERLPYTHYSGSAGLLTTLQHGLLPRKKQVELGFIGALGRYDANGGDQTVFLSQWPSINFMHYFYPRFKETWGLVSPLIASNIDEVIKTQDRLSQEWHNAHDKEYGSFTTFEFRIETLRELREKSLRMQEAPEPERSLFLNNFPVLYLVADVATRVPRGSSVHAEVEVCGDGCVDPKLIRGVIAPREHHGLVRDALFQTERNDVELFALECMKPATNDCLSSTRIL